MSSSQFRLVLFFFAGVTLLFIGLWQSLASFAQANQCFATVGNSTDFASVDAQAVRAAVAAAPANGTVKIAGNCRGVVTQNNRNQVLTIEKNLTLRGGYTNTVGGWDVPNLGSNPTTLDALGSGRVIYASTPLTVENLIIQNGYISGTSGGGIYAVQDLLLLSSQLNHNVATGADFSAAGGGAAVSGSLTMSGTTVYNNRSRRGGGGLFVFGTVAITNSSFISNTADVTGGGLAAFKSATLHNVTFTNNHAINYSGGGASIFEGATIVDSTIMSNVAGFNGGGLELSGASKLIHVTIENNRGFNGGGALLNGAAIVIATTVKNNVAENSGGGLIMLGSAMVSDTILSANVADNNGGGLSVDGASHLVGVRLMDNRANGAGGGAYLSGAAMITASHFISNRAHFGGGAYLDQIVRLGESSFISNTATQFGGALIVGGDADATMPIVNSLFVRNRAQNGTGDALFLQLINPATRVELLNNTIVNPASAVGSTDAIYVLTGTVGITNTIITSHTTAIRRGDGVVYENYNLFFGNTTNFNGAVTSGGQSLTSDPAFANPAADDYHLTAGSGAIDSGSDVALDSDFDGSQRPYGYGLDRGFVEYRYPLPDMSINDGTVGEGGAISFAVTLLSSSARPITVTYTTANHSALAGVDYVAQSGTLIFAPGQTSKTITITTLDENIADSGEGFFVILRRALGANFLDNRGLGTITDSDTTALNIAGSSSEEGSPLNFVVGLTNPSDATITVQYATQDGSAQAGSDYTAANATLSFAPGVLTQTITITATEDTDAEPNETLSVILSNPAGASLATSSGVGTILNNDTATPTATPDPNATSTPVATPNPNATSTPVASATPPAGGSPQRLYLPLVTR